MNDGVTISLPARDRAADLAAARDLVDLLGRAMRLISKLPNGRGRTRHLIDAARHEAMVVLGFCATQAQSASAQIDHDDLRWISADRWREVEPGRAVVLLVVRGHDLVQTIAIRLLSRTACYWEYAGKEDGDKVVGWTPAPGFNEHDPLVVAAMETR